MDEWDCKRWAWNTYIKSARKGVLSATAWKSSMVNSISAARAIARRCRTYRHFSKQKLANEHKTYSVSRASKNGDNHDGIQERLSSQDISRYIEVSELNNLRAGGLTWASNPMQASASYTSLLGSIPAPFLQQNWHMQQRRQHIPRTRVHRWRARRVWQRKAQNLVDCLMPCLQKGLTYYLESRAHGISGVHPSASARPRAGMANDVKTLLVVDLSDGKCT